VTLNSKIEAIFYPDQYPTRKNEDALDSTTLIKGRGLSRYVIHIQSFDNDVTVETQIENARKVIFKRTKACWIFREVGACVIFSSSKLPAIAKDSLEIDKTGLHAVIIQGVHIVSKDGENLYNQSKWFHKTFGKSQDVVEALRGIAI
jgi:hypothetical protein